MPPTDILTPVADDIYQVRLPLPFALNSVNVYLLRDGDGWTLVDTGLNTREARAAWETVFTELNIKSGDIHRIILTHVHPDHYGMAGWFQSRTDGDLPVYLSRRETELVRLLWEGEGLQAREFSHFLAIYGMPNDMIDIVGDSLTNTIHHTYPHPTNLQPLIPGDTITIGARTFRIIHAPGHSDGHLIFYDVADHLMLPGDHVLMKITPNIGSWPDTDPDPLGRYLDSLKSLSSYDVRLALPGHKSLITDWNGRLTELLHHHDQRLDHTLSAIAGGATVYEASRKVFDSARFSPHEWRFAVVETLAHLEYLQQRGQVWQDTIDSIWRFYPAT